MSNYSTGSKYFEVTKSEKLAVYQLTILGNIYSEMILEGYHKGSKPYRVTT